MDNYILHMTLENGNELTLDVKQLFEYSLFAPLKDIQVWRTMRVQKFCIIWGSGNSKIEISIDKILDYFA